MSERRRVMVKDQTYVENMARERTPSLEMLSPSEEDLDEVAAALAHATIS